METMIILRDGEQNLKIKMEIVMMKIKEAVKK